MCVIKLCIPLTLYLLIAIFIEDMENKVIINKINEKSSGLFMKEIFKYTLKKLKGEISKYNVGYAYHLSLDTEILN